MQFDFPDDNGSPYKSSGGKMVWNEKLKREKENERLAKLRDELLPLLKNGQVEIADAEQWVLMVTKN